MNFLSWTSFGQGGPTGSTKIGPAGPIFSLHANQPRNQLSIDNGCKNHSYYNDASCDASENSLARPPLSHPLMGKPDYCIVTEEGAVNLLNTLQPNKASGPDTILSRFLGLSYSQL